MRRYIQAYLLIGYGIPILWEVACFNGKNKKRRRLWDQFIKSINMYSPSYTSKLGCLFIQSCEISDDILYQIGKLCPNLHRLIISNCHGFSSKTIGRIVHSKLTYLKLYNNTKGPHQRHHIRDKTLCEIAISCPNLTYLNLEHSNHISDISVIEIAKSCNKLEHIHIEGSKITDVSLKEIAYSCPKLCHLYLGESCNITNDGICAMAISHPNMHCFSFADFDFMGREINFDTSIRAIARSCHKLKFLNISCLHITDECISTLVELCRNLEGLNLEGCDISDTSIYAIANSCHNIRNLCIDDCWRVTKVAINTLKKQKPNILKPAYHLRCRLRCI
jgi:hypothetical protein